MGSKLYRHVFLMENKYTFKENKSTKTVLDPSKWDLLKTPFLLE